jgi:hypothetical protein
MVILASGNPGELTLSLRQELYKTTDISKQLDLQIYLSHYFAISNMFDSAIIYGNNVVTTAKSIIDYQKSYSFPIILRDSV